MPTLASYTLTSSPEASSAVASVVALCNLALSRIGIGQGITSLEDSTREAQACALHYAHLRDSLLAMCDWPFARKRAALALLSETERSGWDYAYSLPLDCLVPRRVWSGEIAQRRLRPDQRVPFGLEADDSGSGRILLTDEQGAKLLYTARVEDPLLFHPLFTEALVWWLAAELALALKAKDALELRARQRYELALSRAQAHAAAEGEQDVEPEPDFITGRG